MPLSNAPTDLKERAKQGDEKAIAAVLNHFFQPQGITAKANLKGSNLLLLIESEMVPDQDTLVPFIHQGLANLGIANITPNVKIAGREKGTQKGTAWKQEINLEEPPEPIVPDGANDSPLSDYDDMPIEEDDFLDEPLTEDENDDYDLEEDSSLEEEKPQEKSSKKNLLILGVVLLLLLLAGGAAAYFFLPGLLAGNQITSSQPMSTPESDSSTEKPEAPASSEGENTAAPAEGENTAAPAEGENTAAPAEGENTAAPAEGENTAAPAEGENTAAPAEGENTAAPAEGENTAAPAEGENTAAPAEGENTAAPAEGENTAAPAEGENTNQESPETSQTSEEATTKEDEPTSSSVPFYDAVNKANQAWEMTQVASSSQEWTEIAILWNDALVLMKQVPESHSNYELAQDRIPQYRKYREFAKEMSELTSP